MFSSAAGLWTCSWLRWNENRGTFAVVRIGSSRVRPCVCTVGISAKGWVDRILPFSSSPSPSGESWFGRSLHHPCHSRIGHGREGDSPRKRGYWLEFCLLILPAVNVRLFELTGEREHVCRVEREMTTMSFSPLRSPLIFNDINNFFSPLHLPR